MGSCCTSEIDNSASRKRTDRNTDTKPLLETNENHATTNNMAAREEHIESEDNANVDDLLDNSQNGTSGGDIHSSTEVNESSESRKGTEQAMDLSAVKTGSLRNLKTNETKQAAPIKEEKKDISLANVKLDVEHLKDYLGQLSGLTLSIYWNKVDLQRNERIDTNDQLIQLFREIINGYVESVASREAIDLLEATIANFSEDMANHYLNAMDNYNEPDMNSLTKKSFDKLFVQYVLFPQPLEWEKHQRAKRGDKEPVDVKFDMLAYLSTSPTVKGRPKEGFDAKALVQELKEILEGSSTSRGDRFADFVLSLNCTQRIAVRDIYKSSRDQNLKDHLSSSLGKDETRVAQSLFRSFAENDAHWINEALKSNDYELIDEILFTKCNAEIEKIKQAYQKMFDGDMLAVAVNKLKKSDDDYHLLVEYALTLKREEKDPRTVDEKKVAQDCELFKTALEGGKMVDMATIYDIFTHRSWVHLDRVLIAFNKFSKINAKTLMEKKIGGRVGFAFQIIIDIAQHRHSYWALNLKKSMKGLGTNDDLLVRCIVSRSEIDLRDIIVEFNAKLGEGKTLLQWLRDDTSGTYRKILMGFCGFEVQNLGGASGTIHTIETEKKEDTTSKNEEIKDVDDWDAYCVTSPTVRYNDDIDIDATARLLAELAADKKPDVKKFKRELISVLTSIDNEQRQELKLQFQNTPTNPKKVSLEETVNQILGKRGKTTAIVLTLLTPIAQYRAQMVREGLKNLPVLTETICTCTNKQLKDTISAYSTLFKTDMVGEINKATKSKKNLNSILMEILKLQRPETLRVDMSLVTKDAKELKEKGESSKPDAGVWEHFFASRSLTHIKKTAEIYAANSELTIKSVAQKVLGNNSFIAADTIYQMATNRFAFFAIKLRDSMKGVGYKADMLTRVLVLRSEIDMGEVQQAFDKSPDQTNNKTLLQWLTDDLSGSFLSTCLRLSGLHSAKTTGNESDTEYSTVRRKTTVADPNSATHEDDDDLEEDEDHSATETPKTDNQSSFSNYNSEQSPVPLSGNNDADNDHSRKSPNETKKVEPLPRPTSFKVDDFASFIQKRMNEATVNKIWAHLDSDNSGEIEKEELLSLLVFTCVLFQAFVAKTNKQEAPKVDKQAMKDELRPVRNWIVENKMADKPSIKKPEFTTLLGDWLMQYHELSQ